MTALKKTILFFRHGESEANINPNHDNQEILDAILTPLGIEQAHSWSEDSTLTETLASVEVCLCSPLRRAMQTAALVFQNQYHVPIIVNRYAREKWWHLYQCRGVKHAEIVQYSNSLCRDIEQVDRLKEVNKFWNPEEESAAMVDKTPNEFAQLSVEAIQKFLYICQTHEAKTLAVACHWGVIHELLGVEPTNAELLVTELTVDTGEFRIIDRRTVPTQLLRPHGVHVH